MRNILILGYSSLVRRRVLPSLLELNEIGKIFIASRRDISADIFQWGKRVKYFDGYDRALNESSPFLVYISLPNAFHFEWAQKALKKGFNVIVDKPAVTSTAEAEILVNLADNKGLFIAEANVWPYHPLANSIISLLKNSADKPKFVTVFFTSPPLEPENFRYHPNYGGGIIYDRGSYIASCGRIFIGEKIEEVFCRILNTRGGNGVDISICASLMYGDGSVVQGYFSLDSEYRNRVSILGNSYFLQADRIFTPPPDYQVVINITRNNKMENIAVEAGNTFGIFIKRLIKSINENKGRDDYISALLEDNKVIHALRQSAGRAQ